MIDFWYRRPMTPGEFDAACRRFEELNPDASCSSTKRSVEHNKKVGGKESSKHLIGMARDYFWNVDLSKADQRDIINSAKSLGLWAIFHDTGSGLHLHVQGLPPGEIAMWWQERFLPAQAKNINKR